MKYYICILFLISICIFQSVVSAECDSSTGECPADFSQSGHVTSSGNVINQAKVPRGANSRGLPGKVRFEVCEDRRGDCDAMAENDGCNRGPGWMTMFCAKTCNYCHLRDPAVRCSQERLNTTDTLAYSPGDMQHMFSSIQERFQGIYDINIVSEDPWIVTIDNFVSDDEVEHILESVKDNWERSTDTGATNEFGETGRIVSQSRTSSNAWCRHECESDPYVQNVYSKITEVVGIPKRNFENLQILRYERGQYYFGHHDNSDSLAHLPCGPRILTFFLYLSDVEQGGETAFPHLKIKVTPKKGRAVLWPSVYSDEVLKTDYRTFHEAKPVKKGIKLAANAWIHLYDFEHANNWGCTGSFD